MNVNINFTLPDLPQLIVYLVLGILVAVLVGGLAQMRSGLGYLITVLVAALGAWFFANILRLEILGSPNLAGVPLVEAFIGALIVSLVAVMAFRRRGRVVLQS
ncbi:MAG: hypothetical protein HXX08_21370 [Chloroflexi bacterium]|uniref:GlsB/YeaQ/YmgE family stress response membrane protein n=1 Tax=Candidatus Chlorohelix allophototropha TaxID=3003348 RepID=A0A8T7M8E9_9CHLR|nr:hypothetical protein [Chloroflexota bacterium]WJW68349.1 hypothetical protein OZ401_003958 [Chloroflexota bacterium L227-S17]